MLNRFLIVISALWLFAVLAAGFQKDILDAGLAVFAVGPILALLLFRRLARFIVRGR